MKTRPNDDQFAAHVKAGQIPGHVALIPDGNRRFARSNKVSLLEGYQQGYRKVEEALTWCGELGIREVTVWILSLDNFSRPPDELAALLQFIEAQIPTLVDVQRRAKVPRQVRCVGRLEVLPPGLLAVIADAERDTKDFGPFRLNLAIAYGGREQIVDSVKQLLAAAKPGQTPADIALRLTATDVDRFMSSDALDPDLIIRAGGELRLGGFLLWKSTYCELYFCDALWPDLQRRDFLQAIHAFQGRQRRHGA